jgi:cellulose synthase/poly-beta-1,6-N-acetylglucosamine synthase-like glycosyltransferase
VSVHVPCYNEPPEMVKQTLNALANLDYPDFEVLIIDNNTKDPAVWEPVRDYCETLGPNASSSSTSRHWPVSRAAR